MPDEKTPTPASKKSAKPKKITVKRDNLNYPTFDKVTVNNFKRLSDDQTTLINTPDQTKPLPEIELFSHHNFNMLRTPPGEGDGEYKGEPLVSYRTSFGVNLDGHPLNKAVSSIIVYSGFWKLYAGESLIKILGPGHYQELRQDIGQNDSITKIEPKMD